MPAVDLSAANGDEYLKPASYKYNEQRKKLALQGVTEWSIIVDTTGGSVAYTNNINGDWQDEVPEKMDSIGGLASLRRFTCNRNQLRTLPPSLCDLGELATLEVKNNYLSKLPKDLGKLSKVFFWGGGARLEKAWRVAQKGGLPRVTTLCVTVTSCVMWHTRVASPLCATVVCAATRWESSVAGVARKDRLLSELAEPLCVTVVCARRRGHDLDRRVLRARDAARQLERAVWAPVVARRVHEPHGALAPGAIE